MKNLKKMNLVEMKTLSRLDMKKIVAGSGADDCPTTCDDPRTSCAAPSCKCDGAKVCYKPVP